MSDTTALQAACKAQEWHRDGRGLWAMRACRLEAKHGNRHEYSAWRYHVDVREAIAALVPQAMLLNLLGWYAVEGEKPVHDPGLSVSCPNCGEALSVSPRVTISFLVQARPARSYFFRAHKSCWEHATEARRSDIESSFMDAIVTIPADRPAAAPAPAGGVDRAAMQEAVQHVRAVAQLSDEVICGECGNPVHVSENVAFHVQPCLMTYLGRQCHRVEYVSSPSMTDEVLQEMAAQAAKEFNQEFRAVIRPALFDFGRAVLARQQAGSDNLANPDR